MLKIRSKKVRLFIIVILSALIIAVGFSIIYFVKYYNAINNPKGIVEKETQDILGKVGKLIILPKDEVPIIATVTDLSKLKDQQFFLNAKLGDKVIIYNVAKTAVLYDPIANKVVDVAPITFGNNQTISTTSKVLK